MKPFRIPSHRPVRNGLLLTGIIQAFCLLALPEAAIAKLAVALWMPYLSKQAVFISRPYPPTSGPLGGG